MLRRDFLKAMSLATSTAALYVPAGAIASAQPPRTALWVRRGADEMRLDFATEEGYRRISWLLRDVRANKVGIPDWRLLELLGWLQAWLAAYGHHVRFDITSGLRMPSTNKSTEGSAQASYHLPDAQMCFRAIDFTTRTVPSNYMGQLALYAAQGGVGFYPNSNFTHIDTGPQVSSKSGLRRAWVTR